MLGITNISIKNAFCNIRGKIFNELSSFGYWGGNSCYFREITVKFY